MIMLNATFLAEVSKGHCSAHLHHASELVHTFPHDLQSVFLWSLKVTLLFEISRSSASYRRFEIWVESIAGRHHLF